MIGDTLLVPETKKPGCNPGTSGAITARTFSDLFDSLSVHDTGGMCKDSLLILQEKFLNIPAERGSWLSDASLRKESFAMFDENAYQRWQAEIAILAERVLAWLRANENNPKQPIVDAIKRVRAEDCMILGVEDALWADMEAWDYLDENLEHSDVWQCAVCEAIETFKAQPVLAEVQS